MHIVIVTPSSRDSHTGNQITTLRWSKILRQLGARVTVQQKYDGKQCDLLVALHARRSYASVRRSHTQFPNRPIVLALTGTDLYRDIRQHQKAVRSLQWATRLVVLQNDAIHYVPRPLQHKTRVIYQSARHSTGKHVPLKNVFEVCVIGHLRAVKDPFRAAMAARLLPSASQIRVDHFGAALTPAMQHRAVLETERNARYHWHGDVPPWRVLRRLARSQLLVLTSRLEGGANVVSEAIAAQVPVISTRISGTIGLLGRDYPGYFRVGDTHRLAKQLQRAELDPCFYGRLKSACQQKLDLVDPQRELASWRQLITELTEQKILG